MVDIEHLAERHLEVCSSLRGRHREQLLLWYADLGVNLDDEVVNYFCPKCGARISAHMNEFVFHDSSEALECSHCRGEAEERAGALD